MPLYVCLCCWYFLSLPELSKTTGGGFRKREETEQRLNSWTKSRQEFSSLLFTVTSHSFVLRFQFLQTHATSYVKLLCTLKERGGYPDRKPYSHLHTVKRVDEVVRHPHLVTQDQFTQVSKKVFDIPEENFTINI